MKKEYITPELELVELFSRESLMSISNDGINTNELEDLDEETFGW